MGWETGGGTGGEPGRDPGTPGGPGPEPPGGPGRDPRLAGFAPLGEWTVCPPGPELAAAVAAVAGPGWHCPGAEDDELTGVLRRLTAIESWAAAGRLGVTREMIRRDQAPPGAGQPGEDPRECPGGEPEAGLPGGWSESLDHELALALGCTSGSANGTAVLAWDLGARLLVTAGLLAGGVLTYGKARLISETFALLSDADAARAEALLIPQLLTPSSDGVTAKTYGQVAALANRVACQVDPGLAERRRKQAVRERARVGVFREASGAAGLAGRELPPELALAGFANLDARAAEYLDSGAFGRPGMDRLRATAFVDLLNGVPAWERIASGRLIGDPDPGDPDPGDPDPGDPDPGDPDPGDPDPGDPDPGEPGEPGGPGDNGGPGNEEPGENGPGPGGVPAPGADRTGPGESDPGDGGVPGGNGPGDHGNGPGDHGGGPCPDGHGSPGPRRGGVAGGPDGRRRGPGCPPPDDDSDLSSARDLSDDEDPIAQGAGGDGGLGERDLRGNDPEGNDPEGNEPRDPARGDPGPGTGGRLRPADLVLPLATVLGAAERPGESHGFGILDPGLCRRLAALAAASGRTTICLTVTDADGVAIGHGCARPARSYPGAGPPGARAEASRAPGTGQAPRPPGSSGLAGGPTPVGACLPARVNLTVTAELLPIVLGGVPARPGGQDVPGDPPWCGTWTLTVPGGRELTVTVGPVPTFACDHRNESRGYQPSDKLRHLVQVRDRTCTNPVCSRHARDSDFEHAVPFHKGGRTCACNAGARSRNCHRVKQEPGWKVTQPRPGWHQWRTPSGWTYIQAPYRYPA